MISKEDYLHFVKRVVTNGYINPDMLNIDIGQVSPMEQGFIYSITKETLASKTILEGIQFNDLSALEKQMFFDSHILNFLSSKPEPEQFNQNQEFLLLVEGAFQIDPESIIGLYARVYQVIYKKEYEKAIRLLGNLQNQLPLNDKFEYFLVLSHFVLQDIKGAKSALTNMRLSLKKILIWFVIYYYESIVYRFLAGIILLIGIVFIIPFWLPIIVYFLIDILILSIGFFYRYNMVVATSVVDLLANVIFSGLGLLVRYLLSTI